MIKKLVHSACHLLARWFAEPISSTLKMEAIYSSETSGETQRTTRRHISEDDTLHNHRCENLKPYKASSNLTYIREFWTGCRLCWLRYFMVFFSPYRQMPRQYLKLTNDCFLSDPFQLIFHSHQNIRRNTVWVTDTYCQLPACGLCSCFNYFSALKMDAILSFEVSKLISDCMASHHSRQSTF
jgi:hypothetical protein